MKAKINHHVAQPTRWAYCAPSLIALQAILGATLGIAFSTPAIPFFLFLITHPVCIVISMREPHIEAVLRTFSKRRPTPNHWTTEDRTYVA